MSLFRRRRLLVSEQRLVFALMATLPGKLEAEWSTVRWS